MRFIWLKQDQAVREYYHSHIIFPFIYLYGLKWKNQRGNKWNESGFRPPLCTYRLNWARRNLLRMVRWLRWHCPPDTGFEIRALAVWGRARYLSVTEAPHNTNFHTWMGKKQFCFFQTAETGNRTPDSGVKGSGANHYPRAPAHQRGTNEQTCERANKQMNDRTTNRMSSNPQVFLT